MSDYGFMWGPMEVHRIVHIEGRGYVLGVDAPGGRLQIYVSEKGRSVRVWKDNVELTGDAA